MSVFRWSQKATDAALSLANGSTQREAADIAGVTERTIRRWLDEAEFSEEVDRLTFMTGIANKAYRLRMAKQVIAKLRLKTDKDLLEWMKFAQSETDGIKLDFTVLLSALDAVGSPVAGSRQGGIGAPAHTSDGD